jgi:hypothetical protein
MTSAQFDQFTKSLARHSTGITRFSNLLSKKIAATADTTEDFCDQTYLDCLDSCWDDPQTAGPCAAGCAIAKSVCTATGGNQPYSSTRNWYVNNNTSHPLVVTGGYNGSDITQYNSGYVVPTNGTFILVAVSNDDPGFLASEDNYDWVYLADQVTGVQYQLYFEDDFWGGFTEDKNLSFGYKAPSTHSNYNPAPFPDGCATASINENDLHFSLNSLPSAQGAPSLIKRPILVRKPQA